MIFCSKTLNSRHSVLKIGAVSGSNVSRVCHLRGAVLFRGLAKAESAPRGRLVFISLLFIIVGAAIPAVPVTAGENEAETGKYIDPAIPDSWYEAPKTASELGIEEFDQAPMLDERVANGDLPPVAERLPDDPPVVEPYSEVGEYGGTHHMWGTALPGRNAGFWNQISAAKSTPDGEVVPRYIKSWEYEDDFTKLTLYLRKGLKWSDGSPFTSEDYKYAWKHVAHNKKLSPVPPEDQLPSVTDMTFPDKWTVTFHFAEPAPSVYLRLAQSLSMFILQVDPAHFMKQFHPGLANRDTVKRRAEEAGVEWQDYYTRMQKSLYHPEYAQMRPVLRPYIAVKRTVSSLILERNPYFPFVDSEGNQLPYIDRIRVDLANNSTMALSKAITGQATFASWHTSTGDIPVFKHYAEEQGYRILVYRRNYGAEMTVFLNFAHKEAALRRIFGDLRFRSALSLAINRNDINRKLYFGQAVPQQATVPPTNPLYEKRFAQAYAAYNPEKARRLLDEMDIKDVNGDGFRERPDGTTFNPQLIYSKMGPVNPTSMLEMIMNDWGEIGINLDLKKLDVSLFVTRWESANADAAAWMLDQVSGDFLMRKVGLRSFAPIMRDPFNPWPTWAAWYRSDGGSGIEPSAAGKKLIQPAETILHGTSRSQRDAAAKKLLESQAENLWSIGTVALGPQPVIVSDRVKNIPVKGLWAWETTYFGAYFPEQMYIKQE